MKNVPLAAVDHVPRAVLPIGTDYPPGYLLDWQEHRRAQLLYGATGVMLVETGDGAWTVPTDRAVLIPPATRHRVRFLDVSTRSLYVEPGAVPWWPAVCTVADVPPLLRETGTSPAVWRTRARLLAAVPLLRTASVTTVAADLGYASPAAFTTAFTRAFGRPPSRFAR